MDSKYKRLAKNSGIFMIASFGSKLISFILVPFYTHVLSTGDYGTVDALIAAVSLFSPIATLGIGDVIVMILSKREYDSKRIFFNTATIVLIGNILVSLVYPFLYLTDIFKDYLFFFIMLVIVSSLYSVLQMYARGTGKVVASGISGVIYTITLALSNIGLLLFLRMGITGYLLSVVFAYFIPSIYLIIVIENKSLKISYLDLDFIRNVLKLSIPIIPSAVLWSLMNLADKYAIMWFVGTSGNGIYAVAHKIPSIISIIYGIFQQAWQLTTFELESKEERTKVYSNIFEILTCVMFSAAIVLTIVNRMYIIMFCEESYNSAWLISPILIYSSILNCISGLLGSNYLIMHNTKGALKVTAIGALINVALNFILVPIWGLYGAAIATTFGYIYMVVKKIKDTSNFTPLDVNIFRLAIANIIMIITAILVIIPESRIYYAVNIVILISVMFLYKGQFVKGWSLFANKINVHKRGMQ